MATIRESNKTPSDKFTAEIISDPDESDVIDVPASDSEKPEPMILVRPSEVTTFADFQVVAGGFEAEEYVQVVVTLPDGFLYAKPVKTGDDGSLAVHFGTLSGVGVAEAEILSDPNGTAVVSATFTVSTP